MLEISSKENKIFKRLKKLSENPTFRKNENQTILEGEHLIECCLQSKVKIHALFIDKSTQLKTYQNLLASVEKIPHYLLSSSLMREISFLNDPPRLLAIIDIPVTDFDEQKNLNLFIDDVQDPGNLGSIIRSAQAFNVNAIYLSVNCADVWAPKTLRGSQGAQFSIHCHEKQDLVSLVNNTSLPVFALDLQGTALTSTQFKKDMIIIIGNEGNGINEDLRQLVKSKISIPMHISVESLNVASAASIMMYEYNRQYQ